MDSIHKTNGPAAQRGLSADIRRIKQGTAETADELRDFVRTLKGKNPQEVLGAVAQSRLTQGVAAATFWTILFLAAGTAVPHFWDSIFPATAKVAVKPAPTESKP